VRHSPGGKAPKENERQRVGPVGGGVTKLRTGKGAAGKRSKDHMILARYGSFLKKKKEKGKYDFFEAWLVCWVGPRGC